MDKYIIITGACSDMGIAVSKQLIKNYNLLLIDMDMTKLIENAQMLDNGVSKISVLPLDFNSIETIKEKLDSKLKENNITAVYGFIHIAGIAPVIPLKTTTIDDWYKTININFISAVEIVKTIIKKPYRSTLKSIVMVSSVAAHFGVKAQAVYSVSKAMIDAYVRGAAVELAPIRVNAIAPGRVKTNTMATFIGDTAEIFENKHPLRWGTADDIADLLYFLLSDQSKWITGQTYVIDGGVSINLLG